jgi:hypothetical protein
VVMGKAASLEKVWLYMGCDEFRSPGVELESGPCGWDGSDFSMAIFPPRLRKNMKNMPSTTIPITARPPITPPTIGPTGTLLLPDDVTTSSVAAVVPAPVVEADTPGGTVAERMALPEKGLMSHMNSVKTKLGLAVVAHKYVTQKGKCGSPPLGRIALVLGLPVLN